MSFLDGIKSIYWNWLFFKAKYQQTSAKNAIRKLNKDKLDSCNVTAVDLEYLYKNLRYWKDSPTLDSNEKTSTFLKECKHLQAINDDCLGVIVETRPHRALEFVVCNFIENTGKRVQLFHGINNHEYILNSQIMKFVESGKVILTQLPINNLDASLYNSLFLNVSFWDAIVGRGKIIIFQTDSLVCNNSIYTLNDFLKFDYIGASWLNRLRHNGLIVDGGVGGFSLRDYAKSKECTERFQSAAWLGGEDDFFAFHIELIGGKVGTTQECEKFCTQNVFTKKSYGAHQIKNLNKKELDNFLQYCPEGSKIL